MYKATVRALLRHGIDRLNAGDASFLLRMARPDAVIAFPGDNSWAAMHRPVVKGKDLHATHIGIDECRSFAERFVAEGLQITIEDILVNGPPWRMRVVLRAQDAAPLRAGEPPEHRYCNRYVGFLELRWGRLVSWEIYEDTERVAEWDRRREVTTLTG